MPGKCAAPPALVIMTFSPLPSAAAACGAYLLRGDENAQRDGQVKGAALLAFAHGAENG